MVELQGSLNELERQGVRLVAILPDKMSVLTKFGKRSGISFPMLSDEGSRVIDAFKVMNEAARKRGLPHPGTFLIKDGIIVGKLFFEGYQVRHTGKAVLEAARKIK